MKFTKNSHVCAAMNTNDTFALSSHPAFSLLQIETLAVMHPNLKRTLLAIFV